MKKSHTTEPNALSHLSSKLTSEAALPPPSTLTTCKQFPVQKNLETLAGLLTTNGSRIGFEEEPFSTPPSETQSREVLSEEKTGNRRKMRFCLVGVGCLGFGRFHDGWLVGKWRENGMRVWTWDYGASKRVKPLYSAIGLKKTNVSGSWVVGVGESQKGCNLLQMNRRERKGREYWDWRQRKKERQENLCFKKYWEEYSSLDGEKYWAAKGYGDSYAKRLTKLEEYYFEINRNRLLVCIISFANVFNYK